MIHTDQVQLTALSNHLLEALPELVS